MLSNITQTALDEHPALRRLQTFVDGLSAEEKLDLFEAFDEHEFLAYDLFGDYAQRANPQAFAGYDQKGGAR